MENLMAHLSPDKQLFRSILIEITIPLHLTIIHYTRTRAPLYNLHKRLTHTRLRKSMAVNILPLTLYPF